jgi:integrase
MARTVRDEKLESRAARARLEPRGKPYYRPIDEGLHIGYRKPRGRKGRPAVAGKWVARFYVKGMHGYRVETIETADDLSDANGVTVINFSQAQTKARRLRDDRDKRAAGHTGPLKVKDSVEAHVKWMEGNRKSANDARYRANSHIYPELGDYDVAALTMERLEEWKQSLAKQAPRLRTRKGEKQRHRKIDDSEDTKRKRKASANRTLTLLKAALNASWRAGKVPSDAAWRRVQPFENVDAARVRYLEITEAKRFVNASDRDFAILAEGALQSGARYGELCRNDVHDFNHDAGTLAVRQSKGGKPRYIELTEEGIDFFERLAAGRPGNDALFKKADGSRWKTGHQKRPAAAASERAKISPRVNFNVLRHTWASHAVMNGMPLMVVAKNMGHADTRMVEKHYGHLAPSYVKEAVRKSAPKFGIKRRGSNIRSFDKAFAARVKKRKIDAGRRRQLAEAGNV